MNTGLDSVRKKATAGDGFTIARRVLFPDAASVSCRLWFQVMDQFRERLDDEVCTEFMNVAALIITISDTYAVNARRPCGFEVVFGIADHQCIVRIQRKMPQTLVQWRGVWLLAHCAVATQHESESWSKGNGVEKHFRVPHRLVGGNRKLHIACAQPCQQLLDAVVDPALRAGSLGISIKEMGQQLLGQMGIDAVHHAARNRATTQYAGAVTDPATHIIGGNFGKVQVGKRTIQRRQNIRHGIDQRTVEIKDHQPRQCAAKFSHALFSVPRACGR